MPPSAPSSVKSTSLPETGPATRHEHSIPGLSWGSPKMMHVRMLCKLECGVTMNGFFTEVEEDQNSDLIGFCSLLPFPASLHIQGVGSEPQGSCLGGGLLLLFHPCSGKR